MSYLAWLAAVAAAVALFGRRGTILDTMIAIPLKPDRLANARVIEQVFDEYGLPKPIAAAAIVNAYAESGLRADAVGDGGHSVGLFQLNDWGAGSGMTVQSRMDPVVNARTIIEREVLTKRGNALRQAEAEGQPVTELAAIFARDIERPKDKAGAMATRRALAAKMFPTLAGVA